MVIDSHEWIVIITETHQGCPDLRYNIVKHK